MDHKDSQDESRRVKLIAEPSMGQGVIYWWLTSEDSPDEGFRSKAESHTMGSVVHHVLSSKSIIASIATKFCSMIMKKISK